MYLAVVNGTVVATQKAAGLGGVKLLIVTPIDGERRPLGAPHVAMDAAQAGEGDVVTCVGSREAALAAGALGLSSFVPVDAAVIGVVDQVDGHLGGRTDGRP
jgi:ethanolamine utilization protein EutN